MRSRRSPDVCLETARRSGADPAGSADVVIPSINELAPEAVEEC